MIMNLFSSSTDRLVYICLFEAGARQWVLGSPPGRKKVIPTLLPLFSAQ